MRNIYANACRIYKKNFITSDLEFRLERGTLFFRSLSLSLSLSRERERERERERGGEEREGERERKREREDGENVCHRLRRNVKACNKFVAMIRNDRCGLVRVCQCF